MKISSILIFVVGWAFVSCPATARAPNKVKIVGIGAATCAEFVKESKINPPVQLHYLAWLQGYMSGIMIGRPPGVDEGIDLNPKSFPLPQQLAFIRDYCLGAPDHSFTDAVEALYKKLRNANAT